MSESNESDSAPLPAGLEEPTHRFLAWIELERGLSENTAAAYSSDLRQCAAYLHGLGIDDWRTAQFEHVSLWVGDLSNRGYSVSSLARKITTVRMMARYLVRERFREDDFTELLSGPRMVRKLPGALTLEEVERLLESPDTKTPQGVRDRAILELLYSSGLRVSEISDLALQDVDLRNGFLRVGSGKGSKERVVPVGGQGDRGDRVLPGRFQAAPGKSPYRQRPLSEHARQGDLKEDGLVDDQKARRPGRN